MQIAVLNLELLINNLAIFYSRFAEIVLLWDNITSHQNIVLLPSCVLSCLVLHNNQQTSSWSITLMVVVGHGMQTGEHLAS